MPAAALDLTLEQGSDFSRHMSITVGGEPLDLTGYTAQGQVRERPSSASVLASFTFTFDSPRSLGGITMTMLASVSNAIPVGDEADLSINRFYYDVLLIDPSLRPTRILRGRLTVSPGVTR